MTMELKLLAAMSKRLLQAEAAILELTKKPPKNYVINNKTGGIRTAKLDGDFLIVETLDGVKINAGNVRGLTGPKGEAGKSGKSGFSIIGNRGPQGEPGAQGEQGGIGVMGAPGEAGVGIEDIWVTIKNELVILLTDGRQINVGKLPAPVYTGGSGNTSAPSDGVTMAEVVATVNSAIAAAAPGYEPADSHIVKSNATKQLTVGYSAAVSAQGTKSSGTFTPDEANGSFQSVTNGGGHAFGPPANTCTLIVLYTNDSSAGAIATTGFTKVTGDSFTTTDTNAFLCFVTKHGSSSHLHVQAMQ